jgi:hypothetical protein
MAALHFATQPKQKNGPEQGPFVVTSSSFRGGDDDGYGAHDGGYDGASSVWPSAWRLPHLRLTEVQTQQQPTRPKRNKNSSWIPLLTPTDVGAK